MTLIDILLLIFSKKTINTYLKPEIRVVCRAFLAFKYVFIGVFFSKQVSQMIIYNCISEILKTGFSVPNIPQWFSTKILLRKSIYILKDLFCYFSEDRMIDLLIYPSLISLHGNKNLLNHLIF